MVKLNRYRLLGALYRPLTVRVGDRVACLYRDRDIIVKNWTVAPLSWPMGVPVGGMGALGIIVDEELARAIRAESAAALGHWWGVGVKPVWRWRKAFAIGRAGTPGSARLVQAAAQLGANAMKAKEVQRKNASRRGNRRSRAASGLVSRSARRFIPAGPLTIWLWWARRRIGRSPSRSEGRGKR
jgi:hypothetical protein